MARFKFEDGSKLGELGREVQTILKKAKRDHFDYLQEEGRNGGRGLFDAPAGNLTKQEVFGIWDKANLAILEVYKRMLPLIDPEQDYFVFHRSAKNMGKLIEANEEYVVVQREEGLFNTYNTNHVGAFLQIVK